MPVKAIGVPGAGTITIENAAEESTMRQILAAINKSGIPSGKESATPGATTAESDKALAERIKAGQGEEDKFSKRAKVAGDAVAFAADSFGKTFSNTTPTIKDFSGVLSQMPGGNIKGINNIITQFGGTLEDQIQIFRTLSGSGIDLGDSLLQAQLSAGEARLPLEIFGKTVKDNSQMLALAFGSATAGATKFAETQGKFMAQSGQKFAALGFSMDELAQYNASYMEMQQRNGRLSRMSTDEIVAGQERYNEELDRLSKATGLSRQQLDEANKAAQRDARMKLALGKLDEGQQAAVNAKIKQLEQLDPTGKMAAGFKDLIAGGGVALTAEARQFTLSMQSAGVDASKMSRDIFSGSKNAVENMNAGFSKAAKASESITEGERRTAAAMATMGQVTPMLGKAVLQGMGDSAKAAEMAKEEQKKRLEAAKTDPTRQVAGLDQTLTQVQNSFKKSFIETGVLDNTASGMKKAAEGAEFVAQKFKELSPDNRMAALFGAALGKTITDAALSEGYKAAVSAAGAKRAGMSTEDYEKAKKTGKIPEPEVKTTKPGTGLPRPEGFESAAGAADDVAKASKMEKIMATLKSPYAWAIATTAGLIIYKDEVVDFVTPDFLKNKNAATVQKETNKNIVPGAEIPKANEPKVPEVPTGSVEKINQEVNALKTALKDIDYSKLMFPEAVGTSIDSGVIKLKNLRDEITTTTSAFKDFSNVNLQNLNSNISKLSETLKEVNKPKEDTKTSSATGLNDSNKQVVELLNQLNTNMGNLASMQGDAVDYLSKTAKYTRQASNNIV